MMGNKVYKVRIPYNASMCWVEVSEEEYNAWPETIAKRYAKPLGWDYERTKEIASQYRKVEE